MMFQCLNPLYQVNHKLRDLKRIKISVNLWKSDLNHSLFTFNNYNRSWIFYLHGCGLVERGGGGGRYAISGFPTKRITRSCVALSVATASSCVTFSRLRSPDWKKQNRQFITNCLYLRQEDN